MCRQRVNEFPDSRSLLFADTSNLRQSGRIDGEDAFDRAEVAE